MESVPESHTENLESSAASTTAIVCATPISINVGPEVNINNMIVQHQLPYRVFVTPNNTRYWIPICSEELEPKEGKVFQTLNEAVKAYKDYAYKAGFDVRHGTTVNANGVQQLKYLYCNREGYSKGKQTKKVRKRLSIRVGCTAKIIYKYVPEQGYVVTKFEEKHTHPFVDEICRVYMKSNRKMQSYHQKFVLDCAKQRVGPAKAYRLYKEMVGGYSNVGPSVIDFTNHRRDLLAYFKGSDAQVVIDRFFHKQEICSAFYFAFDVDEDNQLSRLFWCDAVSRKNFSLFVDVISFDSTYNTNRYKMVFSPFTAYDHHKSLVLLASGLLRNENVESYVWLFEHFKKAMGGCPRIFTTDQDPSMKIAVQTVFPESRHRLCMWHIMDKLSQKIDNSMNGYIKFSDRLRSIVWNRESTPEEFEKDWNDLMEEYGMTSHSWLSELFRMRDKWIPAYFQNVKLSGLIKTTSISESMNSFFRKFSNRTANLIEFMLYYESGIENQRHIQGKKNYDSEILEPILISPLPLEKHASRLYTIKMWGKFQDELKGALYNCRVTNVTEIDELEIYTLKENNKIYTVEHKLEDHDCSCSCNLFNRLGYPCRHILTVLKDIQLDKLPETLLLTRWTKAANLSSVFTLDDVVVRQSSAKQEQKLMLTNMLAEFHACVDLVKDNSDQIKHLTSALTNAKRELQQSTQTATSSTASKSAMFEEFAGVSLPKNVVIRDPKQAKTKGSGKRLKGGKETAIQSQKKGKRICSICLEYAPHNSRTCPLRET